MLKSPGESLGRSDKMTTIETWKNQRQLTSLVTRLKAKNFEARGLKVIQPFGWVEEWYNIDNDETVILQKA